MYLKSYKLSNYSIYLYLYLLSQKSDLIFFVFNNFDIDNTLMHTVSIKKIVHIYSKFGVFQKEKYCLVIFIFECNIKIIL